MAVPDDERIILMQLRREDVPNDLERLERMLNALPPTLFIEMRDVTSQIRMLRIRAYDYSLDGKRVYYIYYKEKQADGNVLTGIQRLTNFDSFVNAIVGSIVGASRDPITLMDVDKHIKTKDPALKTAVVRLINEVVRELMREEEKEEA
jgi:hypothetical protein